MGLLCVIPENHIVYSEKEIRQKEKRGGNDMTAFDDVRQNLGCSYISDIRLDMRRPEVSLKLEIYLSGFDYTKYPPKELEELYEYLFGETIAFRSYIEAERLFIGSSKQ